MIRCTRILSCLAIGAVAVASSGCLFAARVAHAGFERFRDEQSLLGAERAAPLDPSRLPLGTRVIRDVAYGDDPLQRFDVHAPAHANSAPVIFLVHGGGWAHGDKAMANVVENKARR